ncbi:MAG: hypothetical protein AAB512_05485, partial [Patescibacteria group bacterium]
GGDILTASASGTTRLFVTSAGTLTFSGAIATDITTDTNNPLNIGANGTGNIVLGLDSDTVLDTGTGSNVILATDLNFLDAESGNLLAEITDNGTNGVLNVTGRYDINGTAGVTVATASCITSTLGIVTGSAACPASGSSNWDVISGAITPKLTSTLDLILGSTATASAEFAVTGINDSAPVATLSATTNGNGISLTGSNATIQSLRNNTLNIGGGTTGNIILAPLNGAAGSLLTVNAVNQTWSGTTTLTASSLTNITSAATLAFSGDITITGNDITNTTLNLGNGGAATLGTVSDDDLTITPNGTGNLVLTGDFDSGVLIGATGATTEFPLLVRSGIGSNAALAIDNLNGGDILTASASGTTRLFVT